MFKLNIHGLVYKSVQKPCNFNLKFIMLTLPECPDNKINS